MEAEVEAVSIAMYFKAAIAHFKSETIINSCQCNNNDLP